MYGNPYITNYNPQNEIDKLNTKIGEMERLRTQLQQQSLVQPAINQTFQLAPNSNGMKFANNIDDVRKELVASDTPFFSKDLSVMWIKNIKGEIKSYELQEIVLKDDKDLLIDSLKAQIEELKKERNYNEQSNSKYVNGSTESEKSSNVQQIPRNKKK